MHIAVVEDDPYQASLLEEWLQAAGHDCQVFTSGLSLLQAMKKHGYDLLVVDWLLPDIQGDRIVEVVRQDPGQSIPIIFVTQKADEEDIVHEHLSKAERGDT